SPPHLFHPSPPRRSSDLAFLVAILLTNRLLGWFGAALLVIGLPILYAGSFGVLLASSAFTTLVVIRFVVNVWLQGVASPSWETRSEEHTSELQSRVDLVC